MQRLELEFEHSSHAPGRARHAVDTWMTNVDCAEARVQDVILVVTELVTNSVVHAHSLRRLVLTCRQGRLRIEVYDADPAPPLMRPRSGPQGGYGMRIVNAIAADWGWSPTASGKLVWTEIDC